jgi:hypothetical protein
MESLPISEFQSYGWEEGEGARGGGGNERRRQ